MITIDLTKEKEGVNIHFTGNVIYAKDGGGDKNYATKEYVEEEIKKIKIPNTDNLETKADAKLKLNESKRYTDNEIGNIVDSAPESLNTLNKLATATNTNKESIKSLDSAVRNKVDKIDGKGLSTEDFTTALKRKLESMKNFDSSAIEASIDEIQSEIDVLVSGDASTAIESFNEIIAFLEGIEDSKDLSSIIASINQSIAKKADTSSLSEVAKTGDYNDLDNKPTIEEDNSEALYIADNNGNVIATIDKSGLSTTDLKIKDTEGNLKSILELLSNFNSNMDSIDEKYDDTFYITDNYGNVILKVDKKGLAVSKITSDSIPKNDWQGKVMAIYGDSVAAINNGDYEPPFSLGQKWANYTAEYFNMAKQYGRGIGGQKYAFVNGGGAVSWVTPTGVLINRINDQSYDTWDGTYPSGVTAEMESDGEAIRTRGCLSSWHRITHQFPVSVRDSIDVVLVMCHNDNYDETSWQFVENDTTDPEWAASGSEYYGKINGDYNLATLRGGILSTLMKLQLWMPNAIIVLTTGVSGHGTTGELSTNINSSGLLKIAQAVRDMGKLASIPVIDTFAADGINGWNRTKYIADTIHPYTEAGGKMLARAVIGGMKTILPNFK